MTESEIQSLILRDLTADPLTRLFRSNQGVGWVGQLAQRRPDGSVVLLNARPLHAGLFVGSGDLIGWRSRVISATEVGGTVAVFTSLEVKSPTGRPSQEQLSWRNAVLAAGGIAGIVRSVDEAQGLLR